MKTIPPGGLTLARLLAAGAAAVLLRPPLPGQMLQVVLHDGRELLVHGTNRLTALNTLRAGILGRGKQLRVVLHNTGRPAIPRFVKDPQPVLLRSVFVGLPRDRSVWLHARRSARWRFRLGDLDVWELITPRTPRPRHSQVPASARACVLDGGSQLWWDVTEDGGQPYGLPPRAGPLADACRRWLGMNGTTYRRYPLLAALLRQYTGLQPDERSPKSMHSLGGWARWYNERHGAHVLLRGPHVFGRIPWAKTDCNGHYDQLALLVENFLAHGRTATWRFACVHAQHRLTQGLIAADGPVDWSYRHRYEGSSSDSTGDYLWPQTSHEWDAGLIMWTLLSGDPMARQLLDRRLRTLLALPYRWNRRYGIRQVAWTLRNLRAFHVLWGSVEARTRAALWIDRAFADLGKTPYWPNDGVSPPATETWQGALMDYESWEWMRLGVGTRHRQRLVEAMRHAADHVHELRPGGGYRVPYQMQGTRRDWRFTASMNLWSLPMLWALKQEDGTYESHWRACARTASRLAASPRAMRFDSSRWPGSCPKVFAGFLWPQEIHLP